MNLTAAHFQILDITNGRYMYQTSSDWQQMQQSVAESCRENCECDSFVHVSFVQKPYGAHQGAGSIII